MSDEEPDYLSDEFLAQCIPVDVRPGLLHSTAQKRKHDLLQKQEKDTEEHKKKFKSRSQLEAERREEGLKTAIGEDNKGFQMLQKMGFKPGTGIGRERAGGEASMTPRLTEPISITVKCDRKGLGEKSRMEEKRIKVQEWKKMRDIMSDPNEFRNRKREDVMMRETRSDLRKAQSACKTLDEQNEKLEPKEQWFWPIVPVEKDEDESETKDEEEAEPEEEEEHMEPDEQLKILTCYLRKEYFYCIWCGTSYDDVTDLRESCPGNSRQDH